MSESTPRYNVEGVLLDRPFKIDRLGHLGLYHEDIEAAGDFYRNVLGFRHSDVLDGNEAHPKPRGHFFTHNTDHHTLALITADIARSRSDLFSKGITVNQLSFQVGSLQEMIDGHRMLRDQGINISRVGRDRPGSNWAVYFQDPDGHTIELFYGMEQIGWDGRSKPKQTFAHLSRLSEPTLPHRSDTDEVAEQEALGNSLTDGHLNRDQTPGQYDVAGICLPRPFKIIRNGPVSLYVCDVQASLRFYTELLGFRVTEESLWNGHRSIFLRVGGEHHTLSLHPVEVRKELGLPENTTLMCQGLQVASWKQLRSAVQHLQDHGCQQVDIPREFHLGIDYAAHFVGPEGHCVRVYFDMERIGWDGQPKPATMRPKVQQPWPEVLDNVSDPFAQRCFMGPLG